MRRPSGSWRSVAAWAGLILIATSVPLADIGLKTPASWADKAVHGALYLVLGGLVGVALAVRGRSGVGAWLLALLSLAVFAALDEAHQTWLPQRVASASDWVADVIGATLGLVLGMRLGADVRATRREDI